MIKRISVIKRIGIVVGSSTTPGTNAIISGIVLEAKKNGIEVFGIDQGFDGLLQGTISQINTRPLSKLFLYPLIGKSYSIIQAPLVLNL